MRGEDTEEFICSEAGVSGGMMNRYGKVERPWAGVGVVLRESRYVRDGGALGNRCPGQIMITALMGTII